MTFSDAVYFKYTLVGRRNDKITDSTLLVTPLATKDFERYCEFIKKLDPEEIVDRIAVLFSRDGQFVVRCADDPHESDHRVFRILLHTNEPVKPIRKKVFEKAE